LTRGSLLFKLASTFWLANYLLANEAATPGTAMSPPIRIAFIDLDGTLLSSRLTLSEGNLAALRRATAAGITIILASGRPTSSIEQFSSLLPGSRYIIAANGGAIVDIACGEVVTYWEMPAREVARVLSISRNTGVAACLYTPLHWFVTAVDSRVQLEVIRSGSQPRICRDLATQLPAIKVQFIGEATALEDSARLLSQASGARLYWFPTYPEYLEIMPSGVSKGLACRHLLKLLGIRSQEAMAIGDGSNDLALLRECHLKVAVANAAESLRDLADVQTLSNDEDGVAVAIDALIFGDRLALSRLRRRPAWAGVSPA
jgi:Cof subfamily protein (haloacid dehalogenase superfamily)